jgi:Fe-Mn family superoxide dismutase
MYDGIDRRGFMKAMGVGTLALAAAGGTGGGGGGRAGGAIGGASAATSYREGKYVLPPLPYAYEALEPFLGRQALTLHHDKHHLAYLNGLNDALAKLEAARKAGDLSAVKALSRDLAFNGSGALLHTLYWNSMAPGGRPPKGELAAAIERDFGSSDAFLKHFAEAAKAVEGSGWAILVYEPVADKLLVLQAEKHQNLTVWGVVPLLACDVWEHAYYLDYQNRRPDYVTGFMGVADWESAGQRYLAARQNP